MTTDPVEFFCEIAARHARCFWLDGGGAREWSGRRSLIGWLDDDDVSLTYSAARREVLRHVGGRAEVVGDDIFEVLEAELAAGSRDDQWFGYFGYACRPDLSAAVVASGGVPDAVWMRGRHVRMFDHPEVDEADAPPPAAPGDPDAPLPAAPGAPASSAATGEWAGPTRLRSFLATPARPNHGPPHSPVSAAGGAPASAFGASGPPTVGRAEPTAGSPGVPDEYSLAFGAVGEELLAGNSYEVNLTYRVVTESDLDPVTAYLRLRELNPAPYAGFLQHDVEDHRAWLLSSSPERYALVAGDRMLETKPIKGTTPRGETPDEDEALRVRLASEPKFRSENLMIVDLLRNDLAMVCEPGSVEVPVLMDVESYENVHQLVSTVRGRLRDDVSTVGALRSLFPAGSMTGAPKLRTMQIIENVEATAREVYAGAFGWVSADGRADLGVVIRSLMTAGDGRYVLGTGGGITVHSDLAEEYAESCWKADRLLAVFGRRGGNGDSSTGADQSDAGHR